jgi:hypothetical protein
MPRYTAMLRLRASVGDVELVNTRDDTAARHTSG